MMPQLLLLLVKPFKLPLHYAPGKHVMHSFILANSRVHCGLHGPGGAYQKVHFPLWVLKTRHCNPFLPGSITSVLNTVKCICYKDQLFTIPWNQTRQKFYPLCTFQKQWLKIIMATFLHDHQRTSSCTNHTNNLPKAEQKFHSEENKKLICKASNERNRNPNTSKCIRSIAVSLQIKLKGKSN